MATNTRHNEHHWLALVQEGRYRTLAWAPLVFWIGYAATLVIALR